MNTDGLFGADREDWEAVYPKPPSSHSRAITVRRDASGAGEALEIGDRRFETRSFPDSLAATHRGFTFYVPDPISSIHGLHGYGQLTAVDGRPIQTIRLEDER